MAVRPFDVTYKLMNTRFRPMEAVSIGEPFVLMTEVNFTSPWQLRIIGSRFNQVPPPPLHPCLSAPLVLLRCVFQFCVSVLQPKTVREVGVSNSQIEGCKLLKQPNFPNTKTMSSLESPQSLSLAHT